MREVDPMSICIKNGIRVYPVRSECGNFQIEYSVNHVVEKRFPKIISKQKDVSNAMRKTYEFLGSKLNK